MTRRQMLAAMGAAAAQGAMAQNALRFRGLDHIELTVKDVEKSTMFYAQLFGGADVMKNRTTTRRYIKVGSSYMAIDRADTPRIDHACIGIENFNIDAVHSFLTAQGLMYRDYPSGRDTGVNDPDGTRLQLSPTDGWTALATQTALPESRTARAIIQPFGLTTIQINVSNLEAGSAHYGKIFPLKWRDGYTINGSVRIALSSGPPGYNRFTIVVRPFDVAELSDSLAGLGATVESAELGRVQFRDPDGFHVELTEPPRIIATLA